MLDSAKSLGSEIDFFKNKQTNKKKHTLLLSTPHTTWDVAGRKRRLYAARRDVWARGGGDVVQRQCLFNVNPDLPGTSSCFAATESCVVYTFSWVVYWQSCETSKPFNPLMLNMVDILCPFHFSDFGVVKHVSSGLVDSFP